MRKLGKKKKVSIILLPARRGRGTPPTKMVLRGSSGWEPSMTKSLSLRFQGRIWTCESGRGLGGRRLSSSRRRCFSSNLLLAMLVAQLNGGHCCLGGLRETWSKTSFSAVREPESSQHLERKVAPCALCVFVVFLDLVNNKYLHKCPRPSLKETPLNPNDITAC